MAGGSLQRTGSHQGKQPGRQGIRHVRNSNISHLPSLREMSVVESATRCCCTTDFRWESPPHLVVETRHDSRVPACPPLQLDALHSCNQCPGVPRCGLGLQWLVHMRRSLPKESKQEAGKKKDDGHPKFISQPQTRHGLMPMDQAIRQTCQGHITLRLKTSLRTNMARGRAPILHHAEKTSSKIPFRWRPFSVSLATERI